MPEIVSMGIPAFEPQQLASAIDSAWIRSYHFRALGKRFRGGFVAADQCRQLPLAIEKRREHQKLQDHQSKSSHPDSSSTRNYQISSSND